MRNSLVVSGMLLGFAQLLSASFAQADNNVYIPVGQAKIKKTVIAFPAIKQQGDATLGAFAKTITDTVNSDLSFMDIFKFLPPAAFVEPATAGLTPDTFKMSDWTSIGTEFLLKSAVSRQGDSLVLEAYLYDVQASKQVLAKRYVAAGTEAKTLAHTLANNVVETLTGLPGIFLTKIAMSCDRTGKKEIYIMNFDGTEAKQVTTHRSTAFAPAWSPDGSKLVYSVYVRHHNGVKNLDLYEFDFNTSTYRMLSNRKGMNSGAAFAPDGHKIAMTMSFTGNPQIFTLDPASSTVTRVTNSMGFEVDPSFSPDGQNIAFVSSRSGHPMIYKMKADGSDIQRLTYAGVYNATPTWSPQNNKIGFAGDLGGHFDIFIMNPDGTHIERLTKNQGNNEDPYFSPDGNFLVFSSRRTGQANIYVMNVDGTFVKRLTYGLGNCAAPKWSGPPQSPVPAAVPAGGAPASSPSAAPGAH